MTAQVLVTFDITGATSEDYAAISEELATFGLTRELIAEDGGRAELPMNTYGGEFKGVTDSVKLRDQLTELVSDVIKSRKRRGPVFVLVAPRDWAWKRIRV